MDNTSLKYFSEPTESGVERIATDEVAEHDCPSIPERALTG